jgi:hypothetical protein
MALHSKMVYFISAAMVRYLLEVLLTLAMKTLEYVIRSIADIIGVLN